MCWLNGKNKKSNSEIFRHLSTYSPQHLAVEPIVAQTCRVPTSITAAALADTRGVRAHTERERTKRKAIREMARTFLDRRDAGMRQRKITNSARQTEQMATTNTAVPSMFGREDKDSKKQWPGHHTPPLHGQPVWRSLFPITLALIRRSQRQVEPRDDWS